ncbi:MAG: FHA domain-containing protein, partial [Planctomycetes bacterium]|nr:FHA domain-containing protein [Planctomycetota bacterium]
IALALDYFFVGNLNPPHVGSWKLLEAAPWIVYLAAFGLWAASFIALQSFLGSKMTRRFLLYGMLAGIAAFLLHATAEFTFRIPALGGTALVFCTLLVNQVSPGKTRHIKLGDVTGALVLLPVFGIAIAWSIGIVPAARDYAFLEGEIFRLRSELSGGEEEREMGRPLRGHERLEKQQKILCLFRAALEGVRWDEPCGEMLELNPGQIRNSSWLIRSDPEKWHQRALQAVKVRTWLKAASGTPFAADDLMSESCSAARRASRMNPLKAKYKRILGRVLLDSGEEQEGIEMIRAAVRLNPTLPSAWFEAAREIEKVTGELSPFVCKAYAKALALSDRQYHDRNRLRPQLVIHRGPVRREIVLAGEEEWYLKSDRQNLVEVSSEPGTRPHARLLQREGGWVLENGAGNIVPVMGERRIEDRASLSHGDAFRMGPVRFMLENPVQLIQKKLEECR